MALSQLTFLTTHQCPLECRFCGTSCGPKVKGRLSREFMEQTVSEVASWGYLELVVFTGGEPLLLGEDLKGAIRFCRTKEVLTRVVTSAYWATSRDRARAVLGDLQAAGLTEINFSVDDFHQEYVPLDNIGHAMDAAEALGMPYLLAHKQMRGSAITVGYLEKRLKRKLHLFRKGKKNPTKNVISSGITVPIGRGSESVTVEDWYQPELCGERPWEGACTSVMEGIVVTPERNVEICCGITRRFLPEFSIGNLDKESLPAILDRGNRDLIVNWLALEGPDGIRRFVKAKRPDLDLPEIYANPCHLCDTLFSNADVRAVLRFHAGEKVHDLMLKRGLLEVARRHCKDRMVSARASA